MQASGGTLGFAAIAGLLLALWSASRGMSGLKTSEREQPAQGRKEVKR